MNANTRTNLDEYRWEGFFEEFQNETPRACVIVSAAFLDHILRDILASFMIPEKKSVDDLLGTDKQPERPLSSFGARISSAYCLGLINRLEHNDLMTIKKMRNKFAHNLHGISFDTQEIIDLCNNLKTPTMGNHLFPPHLNTPRSRYTLTVSLLSMQLGIRIFDVQKEQRTIRNYPEIGQVIKVK